MGQVISVTNQKGGVGKTTTAVSLAVALALKGKKTLLVDIDPQASASSGLACQKTALGIYQALMGKKPVTSVIHGTKIPGLSFIPSDIHLAGAEVELVPEPQRVFFLKRTLDPLTNQYDFIVIDTPPSLGLLTLNALTASSRFVIPLQCEYYALEGLNQLLETARKVKQNWRPDLKLQGILLTLFDSRNSLSHRVEQEVRRHFHNQVFQTVIPRNVRLSEAPSFGQSIFQYEPHCAGARAYEQMAGELIAAFSGQTPAFRERAAHAN